MNIRLAIQVETVGRTRSITSYCLHRIHLRAGRDNKEKLTGGFTTGASSNPLNGVIKKRKSWVDGMALRRYLMFSDLVTLLLLTVREQYPFETSLSEAESVLDID
jgi:hypothetical protein